MTHIDQLNKLRLLYQEVEQVIENEKLHKCRQATKHLQKVCYMVGDAGNAMHFLSDLVHSAECNITMCTNICRLFRIIRHHTLYSNHRCGITHYYRWLLRLHVYSCSSLNCSLNRCRMLRIAQVSRDAQHA